MFRVNIPHQSLKVLTVSRCRIAIIRIFFGGERGKITMTRHLSR